MKSTCVMLALTMALKVVAQQPDSLDQKTKALPFKRVLIINSFDAMSTKERNNKKDLFRELTDSLVIYLSNRISAMQGYEPVIIPNILSKADNLDRNVVDLIKEKNAFKAIVVWSLNAHFEEAGEREETNNEDGKPRTITTYNLCITNDYILYNRNSESKQSTIENCEFFTTRSVKGRFVIKFGPDIVGKRKHTYKKVENNANAYLTAIHPFLISN